MERSSQFIELSHELADGMSPYPGLPEVRIGAHLDHEQSRSHYEGEEFFLGRVDMPANVGTYLDAPFHRFADREDLSQVPLGVSPESRGWSWTPVMLHHAPSTPNCPTPN
jgi:kynurenine formamidase